MPKAITIHLIEHYELNFHGNDIQTLDFNYNKDIVKINLKDGSFYEIYKRNILWVQFINEKEGN